MLHAFGALGPRLLAWWSVRTSAASVEVEGLANVPATGPVLLVARHVHDLLDGAVLVRYVPRDVHIVVALDPAANPRQRRWMERICTWAGWPVMIRQGTAGRGGAYTATQAAEYLRAALRTAARLLRDGHVLAVFPEGNPAIEPERARSNARQRETDEILPFAGGYQAIVRRAEQEGARDVAVVPVGFAYERAGRKWRVRARFGAPLPATATPAAVEDAVRALSR
ncbi:MAG TPA: 1-acyl-sn-glycerol-3-phosphate acyltransferase [Candidatus Elarobacter sp.]|jgi:putative membrane protein|nr:1-acyl-sn-glycerol-3-phosphate acyltransferase [Candidatus Elarobacter sp.]